MEYKVKDEDIVQNGVLDTLNEVRVNLTNSFNTLMSRGDKLDNLLDKSESLKKESRRFNNQAEYNNMCCITKLLCYVNPYYYCDY